MKASEGVLKFQAEVHLIMPTFRSAFPGQIPLQHARDRATRLSDEINAKERKRKGELPDVIPAGWIHLGACRHMQHIDWRSLMTSDSCFFIHLHIHTAQGTLQICTLTATNTSLPSARLPRNFHCSVARNLLYYPAIPPRAFPSRRDAHKLRLPSRFELRPCTEDIR